MLSFRKAAMTDFDQVMDIIHAAKEHMRAIGNTIQWEGGYPEPWFMAKEIKTGNCYVGEENGKLLVCLSLVDGIDPTYTTLKGHWLDDAPYTALHRLAVAHSGHGYGRQALEWAKTQRKNLRIDTHEVNDAMKHLLKGCGFHYCGIIQGDNGMQRIAYQYVATKDSRPSEPGKETRTR